jgi:hypothetical protein
MAATAITKIFFIFLIVLITLPQRYKKFAKPVTVSRNYCRKIWKLREKYLSLSPFASLNCYIYESVQENRSLTIKIKKNMHDLVSILVPLACGCVLPIMIVWFSIRESMNKTNQRTQIVLAAIEKNPDMDIEELMKKISPKPKLLKEKLLSKLLWGSIIGLLGFSFLVYGLFIDCRGGMNSNDLIRIYFAGGILLAVGIAFLVNYCLSKKMLAKEIEAEEKLQIAQAENQ